MLGFGLVWKVPSGQVQVQGCYPCLLSDIKESRVATKILFGCLKNLRSYSIMHTNMTRLLMAYYNACLGFLNHQLCRLTIIINYQSDRKTDKKRLTKHS